MARPAPTPLRRRLRLALITASFGFWLLVAGWVMSFMIGHMLLGMGKAREVQVLAKVASPDGFFEARVLRIVGPRSAWQEVQIARRGDPVRFLEPHQDPGFVCNLQDDDERPGVSLRWQGAGRLQLEPNRTDLPRPQGGQVLGIRIDVLAVP